MEWDDRRSSEEEGEEGEEGEATGGRAGGGVDREGEEEGGRRSFGVTEKRRQIERLSEKAERLERWLKESRPKIGGRAERLRAMLRTMNPRSWLPLTGPFRDITDRLSWIVRTKSLFMQKPLEKHKIII